MSLGSPSPSFLPIPPPSFSWISRNSSSLQLAHMSLQRIDSPISFLFTCVFSRRNWLVCLTEFSEFGFCRLRPWSGVYISSLCISCKVVVSSTGLSRSSTEFWDQTTSQVMLRISSTSQCPGVSLF